MVYGTGRGLADKADELQKRIRHLVGKRAGSKGPRTHYRAGLASKVVRESGKIGRQRLEGRGDRS